MKYLLGIRWREQRGEDLWLKGGALGSIFSYNAILINCYRTFQNTINLYVCLNISSDRHYSLDICNCVAITSYIRR